MLGVVGMEVVEGVLVGFVSDEALLGLEGVSNNGWIIVGFWLEIWVEVAGCDGELWLVVAM